jgi:ribosome-associated protein
VTIIARKPTAKAKVASKTAKLLAKETSSKRPPLKKVVEKAVAKKKAVSAKASKAGAAKKKAVAPKKAAAKKPAAKKPVSKRAAPKAGKAVAPKASKAPAPKKVAPKKIAAKKTVAAKKLPPKKVTAPKTVAPKVVAKAKAPVAPKAKKPSKPLSPIEQLVAQITRILDDGKAEDIVAVDMAGKSAIADYMVIATGRSQRQLGALAENLRTQLKMTGRRIPHPEGMTQGDWVLLDAGDVIVHLFRPEVRGVYNLEKMWSQPFADSPTGMEGLLKDRNERIAEREGRQNGGQRDGQRPGSGGSKPDFRKRRH